MNLKQSFLWTASLSLGLFITVITVTAKATTTPPEVANTAASELRATVPPDGRLHLDFHGVPLDTVLDYFSDAGGLLIIKQVNSSDPVDVFSDQPLTLADAVDLLNTVLNQHDSAAIRRGKQLSILAKNDVLTHAGIPVVKAERAEDIPETSRLVTQILPVKHANAAELTSSLEPLLSDSTILTVNDEANALVITATQAEIKRLAKIINALDDAIATNSRFQVVPLKVADATEIAREIQELFQSAPAPTRVGGSAGGSATPAAGVPDFGAATGGPAGAASGRSGAGSGRNKTPVLAVADEHRNAVILSAPEDLLPGILDIINELDVSLVDITELRIFPLKNADPFELTDALSQLFPDPTGNEVDGNPGPAEIRVGATADATGGSDRAKKKARMLPVPDPRTGSLIISAASEVMPEVAKIIAQLDASPRGKQKIIVYDLANLDAPETAQILSSLFGSASGSSSSATTDSVLTRRQSSAPTALSATSTTLASSSTSRTTTSASTAAPAGP